jgi:phospholipid/cholesterol/gamma-HCH transport system substrate-binding protein
MTCNARRMTCNARRMTCNARRMISNTRRMISNAPRQAATRMPRWLALSIAALAAVTLSSCALSLQTLPKITGNSAATYPLRAVFSNVLNLPEDAQVRVGAQVVGQVGQISTSNFQADLTLDIKTNVHVLQGTTAQIRFDNPLGDEYVLLEAPPVAPFGSGTGSPAYLSRNALIPETDTSTAASVEDTFGALSLVLNGGGINQLQTIIHELNNTFNGNQPQIRSFLTTINQAVASLAGGRQAIDNALTSIENLTHKLNGGRQTIANGISTIAPAIGVLASENQQISSLISELSNLGVIGTKVAQQSGENSVADVKALLPVVQQLQSVSAQLNPDLGDLARFEADSLKVAPGGYLQTSVIANVLLPAGGFEPTSVNATTDDPSGSQGSNSIPSTGSQAVSSLLEGGLV